MSDLLKRAIQHRHDLVKKQQQLARDAWKDGEQRPFTPEEREKIDKMETDILQYDEDIKRLKAAEERSEDDWRHSDQIDRQVWEENRKGQATLQDHETAFRAWASHSYDDHEMDAAKRTGLNLHQNEMTFTLPQRPMSEEQCRANAFDLEYRATTAQSTTAAAKGKNATHSELVRTMEKQLKAFGGMRQVARVVRNGNGRELLFPDIDDTGNTGAIVGQNSSVATADMALGQTSISTYKYTSKMVRVSLELLQDDLAGFVTMIGDLLGERVGRILNTHFSNSTGGTKPKGVQNSAPIGYSATTGADSSNGIAYSSLVKLQAAIDPAYQMDSVWMMHQTIQRDVRLLLDGNNNPIFRPGNAIGDVDTILNKPVIMNQDLTSTSTGAGAKLMLYGWFGSYVIRDVMDMQLLRLDERFADQGQVAFLTFSRHGGGVLFPSTSNAPIQALKGTT